jgi:hypothetical protein
MYGIYAAMLISTFKLMEQNVNEMQIYLFSPHEWQNFSKIDKCIQEFDSSPQCCGSGMFIPVPGSEFFYPGSLIQGSKRFRIPDPHQRI